MLEYNERLHTQLMTKENLQSVTTDASFSTEDGDSESVSCEHIYSIAMYDYSYQAIMCA